MAQDPVPQFGAALPGLDYRPRPSAFGLYLRDDGRLAAVRIRRSGGRLDHDLPGGALDEGESETQALVREFREETGLQATPGAFLFRANQYVADHESGPVNNLCGYYRVDEARESGPIQEPDHDLVWLDPGEAAGLMYKESAAWAIRRALGLAGE